MGNFRQLVHLEAPHGFLNDPNGICWYQGRCRVFHQWNRFACDRTYKEWGQFCSDDLLSWRHEGTGILPDTLFDRNGCYSGCAVVDGDTMHLFYTGNTKTDDVRKSYQCHAISRDGRTFIKQPDPLETPAGFSEHFRDPSVWKGEDGWWMIVGAQDIEARGRIALFSSPDLNAWRYEGLLCEATYASMCECPGIRRVDGADLLITCPQKKSFDDAGEHVLARRSQYEIGVFDEASKRFVSRTASQQLDKGLDFYAPQMATMPDGRVLLWAWMSGMKLCEEQRCPTIQDGYLHCLTFPRELSIREGRLYQVPARELMTLRVGSQCLAGDCGELPQAGALDFVATLDQRSRDFEAGLLGGALRLTWKRDDGIFRMSGPDMCSWDRYETEAEIGSLRTIEILCDRSSVEVFLNGGAHVFSARVFAEGDRSLRYRGLGESGLATCYELQSIYR